MKSWKDIVKNNINVVEKKDKKEEIKKNEKPKNRDFENSLRDLNEEYNLEYGNQLIEIKIDFEEIIRNMQLDNFYGGLHNRSNLLYEFIKNNSEEYQDMKKEVENFNRNIYHDNDEEYILETSNIDEYENKKKKENH